MIDIIITADYEIFGNGTGDVHHCLAKPTEKLLDICDVYGAKLTLFFEIVEYWAFKEAARKGRLNRSDSRAAQLMKQQAVEAVQRKHDVQLHIHPQWLGAEHTDQGWQLNMDYWSLPKVPHGLGEFSDIFSLRGLLSRGKQDLEAMLTPYDPDYLCIALRAGGWCIQPAHDVITAMRDVGLLADSSVFKGGYLQEKPYHIDFRAAYSNCLPWRAHPEDINRPAVAEREKNTIWEMPIFALQKPRLNWLGFERLRKRFTTAGRGLPPGCRGVWQAQDKWQTQSLSVAAYFRYMRAPEVKQWDYSTLTSGELWEFFKYFLKNHYSEDRYVPLVMTGHPKLLGSTKDLYSFLRRLTSHRLFSQGKIQFVSMQNAVKKLNEDWHS